MVCLQTRMILNAGNLAMAMVFVVTSIWGMNLSDDHTGSYTLFALVSLQLLHNAVSSPTTGDDVCSFFSLDLFAGHCRVLLWGNPVLWCAHGMVHLEQNRQQSIDSLL